MEIFTIGHSNREFKSFVRMLHKWNIDTLVDVRSLPGSRRCPQFNKEYLERMIPMNDMDYIHLSKLGGLRNATVKKRDSINLGFENDSFRKYADYMQTNSFDDGIDELLKISDEQRIALCCKESWYIKCHRRLISDQLKSMGITVRHITSGITAKEHEMTGFAKLEGDKLYYPKVSDIV